MSYRTGDSVIRDGIGALLAVATCVIVVAIIVVAGWQAGWWFQTENTNRQAQLDHNGFGFQQPLQIQIGDQIGQVLNLNDQLAQAAQTDPTRIGTLAASRKGTVVHICQLAAMVNPATPLAPDQADFVKTNCYAGSISPTSLYK